jgi:hypothetical protein
VATWLLVWFLVAILSTIAVIACVAAVVRHVMVLGRSARELREAVQPLADEVRAAGRRASERASSLEVPGRPSPRRG